MHCQIKVDFNKDDLELIIEGEVNSSWRAVNVKELPTFSGSKHIAKYIDINVAKQMCDEAYKAGGKDWLNKINRIKQILKG